MSEKLFCRFCNTPTANYQGRGKHESHCVPKNGGRIVGDGPERHFIMGDGRRIDAPNMRSQNAPSTNGKQATPNATGWPEFVMPKMTPGARVGAYVVTADGQNYRDAKGRIHPPYDGRECEVCGAKGPQPGEFFPSLAAWFSHRNWHVRHGEARWGPKADRGETTQLIPISKHARTLAAKKAVANQPLAIAEQPQQAISIPQQTQALAPTPAQELLQAQLEEAPHTCDATGALELLKRSLTLVTLAETLMRISPEAANQLVGTVSMLGQQQQAPRGVGRPRKHP